MKRILTTRLQKEIAIKSLKHGLRFEDPTCIALLTEIVETPQQLTTPANLFKTCINRCIELKTQTLNELENPDNHTEEFAQSVFDRLFILELIHQQIRSNYNLYKNLITITFPYTQN
jgi:hypothetical protein